ncbi:UDP-glucuronosyltransferase 2C1-like isoform X1 [Sitophilus oryzae]|uniref:UDP-glucuronosyltransferase 2C1-like isoform X1 n=1 Tax=Sitophilus oryzae TaxID=7048 RepID=A0A6J2YNK0_SITOR|nr:UDP-glucuronosyltransferase 2C1-like isoform X1 [Sitophilus oryzae]
MHDLFVKFSILCCLVSYGESARILGVFPMSAGSHYILDYKLMKGLADAGHDVIMLTPYKQENPPKTKGNYTEIILDGFRESISVSYGESARILGVFPISSGSHYILDYKLMKGLADAGHDVTMITPFKQKNLPKTKGNYTEIILDGFEESMSAREKNTDMFKLSKLNMAVMMSAMIGMFGKHMNDTLHHPKVRALLSSNEKFDAIIVEPIMTDIMKIFPIVFNCPVILLFSLGPNSWINPSVGNPQEISYARHMYYTGNNEVPMTFFGRIINLLYHVYDYLFNKFYYLPLCNKVLQKAYPGATPNTKTRYTNASLVLLNSHTSLYPAHPLVPNMVEIGGYHVDPPGKLPKDLQEFLDNAKDGAIYFSMGSNLKSKLMSEERKKMILNVLGRLKQKVIWKFEEELPGKPDNVLIKKWLPQQDILAHPNIKLFITHGGLLSTTETVYHGVPILAIPVFGDQPANAEKAQYAGYAIKLGYHDDNFTEENFEKYILELLNNPKYRENAQRRSKLFHDRPMKPMDTAVYWVEYVIRNNGARHLRVAGADQAWYEYHLVDVALFLLASLVVVFEISKFVIKKVFLVAKSKLSPKKKLKTK